MKIQSVFAQNFLIPLGQFIVLALIFAICYTQDPLYTQNQTTKFLYGLANAGVGFLKEDWLANTTDPLPLFSFLVTITYRYLTEYAFYLYYILILGLYLYSNLGIVSILYKINRSKLKYLTYLALILAIHCIHIKIFAFDTGFHLHSGVAKQYVLGSYFQPSTFGVFLIFSIYAFLRKKNLLAVFALALAATFHPTYIISAAIITLCYLMIIYKEEANFKKVILIGALAFILILPVFSYMYLTFRSTSPEIGDKAQSILVNTRIPHHSLPKVWVQDSTAYVQTLIVFYATYLVRRTRLFVIMFFPTLTATILTITEILMGNNTLAFIAPWRFSAFLVPISTFIITAYWITEIFDKFHNQILKNRRIITSLTLATILGLLLAGSIKQVDKFTPEGSSIPNMMNFVKQTRQAGNQYLIPFDVVNTVDVQTEENKENEIFNLEQFRLYTGAPIFINFKSHPYKDVEVIEWYKRVLIAKSFYESKDNKSCERLKDIAANYGVTHVIFQINHFSTECDGLEKLYENKRYLVYRINN